eukprot:4849583-Alexandrium_andersonii.AAC.1
MPFRRSHRSSAHKSTWAAFRRHRCTGESSSCPARSTPDLGSLRRTTTGTRPTSSLWRTARQAAAKRTLASAALSASARRPTLQLRSRRLAVTPPEGAVHPELSPLGRR